MTTIDVRRRPPTREELLFSLERLDKDFDNLLVALDGPTLKEERKPERVAVFAETENSTDSPITSQMYFPAPVLAHVFDYVDCDSLLDALLVSKQWLEIGYHHDNIWRRKFHKDFGGDARSHRDREDYIGEWNMRHGKPQVAPIHAQHCVHWSLCGSIALGHSSGDICVIDLDTKKCVNHIEIAVEPNVIVSNGREMVVGFVDGCLGWWELDTGAHVRTCNAHENHIQCLDCDGQHVVSCSTDPLIKLWDLETGECVCTYKGHKWLIICIQMTATRIISGSCDGELKVWDRQSGACMSTVSHFTVVECLKVDHARILSVDWLGVIKVWDLKTLQCIMELETGMKNVTCLFHDDTKVVLGVEGGSNLKLWSLSTGEYIRTIEVDPTVGHLTLNEYFGWDFSILTSMSCTPSIIRFRENKIVYGERCGYLKEVEFI